MLLMSLLLFGCGGAGSSGLVSSNSLSDSGGGGGGDVPPGAHSPEPTTIVLFGLGAAGILAAKRKKSA